MAGTGIDLTAAASALAIATGWESPTGMRVTVVCGGAGGNRDGLHVYRADVHQYLLDFAL